MSQPSQPPMPAPPAGQPPPPVPPAPQPGGYWVQAPRPSSWRRAIFRIALVLLVLSVIVNLYLLLALGLTGGGRKPFEATVRTPGERDQVVAVLNVSGLLDGDQARLMERFCRQVKDEGEVKAVVLRIVSGGGGISACDEMYRALKDLKERTGKKIVVSMGAVAASGGYYISAPADEIVAEPTTITGSIGVIAMYPILKGTLDKIGVKMEVVRSTHARAWKAAPNYFEEPTAYQQKDLQDTLDAMQDRFEKVVRDERAGKITIETARRTYVGPESKPFTIEETTPFNGKVYLAEEARKLGLVDAVGYLDDAIAAAARLANLSRPKVMDYSKRKTLLEEIGFARGGMPLGVDIKLLEELQTPRLLMVWKVEE